MRSVVERMTPLSLDWGRPLHSAMEMHQTLDSMVAPVTLKVKQLASLSQKTSEGSHSERIPSESSWATIRVPKEIFERKRVECATL